MEEDDKKTRVAKAAKPRGKKTNPNLGAKGDNKRNIKIIRGSSIRDPYTKNKTRMICKERISQ